MLRLGLGLLFGAVAIQAQADESDLKIAFSERYIACFKDFMSDDGARLACYDSLITPLTEWLADDGQVPKSCEVEDWNFSEKAGKTLIVGATSCASGRLDYRLYDGDRFLTSGFTYFEGFAFQTYADVANPPNKLSIKYTIGPR